MYDRDKVFVSKEKVYCYKCSDTYHPTHGGLSVRKSCRYHHFDKDNICVNCKMKNPSHGNCYHRCEEKKFFFDCIIS